MIGILGCCSACSGKNGANMFGLGLGDVTYDYGGEYGGTTDPSQIYNTYGVVDPNQPYDPSLAPANSHPLFNAAVSNAFASGVRVFENIFTPKPTYTQTTSPQGSSTTVWGSNGTLPSGLNLVTPTGGLSITSFALGAIALIFVASMFNKETPKDKGKGKG